MVNQIYFTFYTIKLTQPDVPRNKSCSSKRQNVKQTIQRRSDEVLSWINIQSKNFSDKCPETNCPLDDKQVRRYPNSWYHKRRTQKKLSAIKQVSSKNTLPPAVTDYIQQDCKTSCIPSRFNTMTDQISKWSQLKTTGHSQSLKMMY